MGGSVTSEYMGLNNAESYKWDAGKRAGAKAVETVACYLGRVEAVFDVVVGCLHRCLCRQLYLATSG